MITAIQLLDLTEFITGSSQFRIGENKEQGSPSYLLYSQMNLREDEQGVVLNEIDNKIIRTYDEVTTLIEGDMVFSLISGTAVIVGKSHEGYLYTQNYIKLIPNDKIYSKFLVYCLNENKEIKKQLQTGLQGSIVMKHTLKQLKELIIPRIPELSRQVIIGEIYFKQQRLNMLKIRVANLEKMKILKLIEEEIQK